MGLLVGEHVPVGTLEPIDQAEFWLRETDRILAADPDNAELVMGAALVLDSPGFGFFVRHMKHNNVPNATAVPYPELDYDAVERATELFEAKCRPRCLALAAKATELQPTEVRWWRMRAMLLFRNHKDTGPRDLDRLKLWTECAKHDPENALYDYLTALQFLKTGLDLDKLDQPVGKAREPNGPQPSVLAHVASWLAAYAIAFAVLGMFPAEIVPPAVQGWIILGSTTLFVTITVGWIVWKIMVRRRFQYTIRTMLIVTFFWALLLGLLRTWNVIPFDLSDLSLSPHVPARGWSGLDSRWLQEGVVTDCGVWAWAMTQWMIYSGPYVAIGVALALLAFWHHLRTGWVGSPSPVGSRGPWASLLATLGRSMLAVAILWMLVYLALTPSVVQSGEDAYQARMVYLRDPEAYYDALQKTMAEVRADWSWMERRGGERKANFAPEWGASLILMGLIISDAPFLLVFLYILQLTFRHLRILQ